MTTVSFLNTPPFGPRKRMSHPAMIQSDGNYDLTRVIMTLTYKDRLKPTYQTVCFCEKVCRFNVNFSINIYCTWPLSCISMYRFEAQERVKGWIRQFIGHKN